MTGHHIHQKSAIQGICFLLSSAMPSNKRRRNDPHPSEASGAPNEWIAINFHLAHVRHFELGLPYSSVLAEHTYGNPLARTVTTPT